MSIEKSTSKINIFKKKFENEIFCVATLAFGSRPRQRGCKVVGLIVDPGVTSHAPGSAKSVRE
jgi:hypothetical protein